MGDPMNIAIRRLPLTSGLFHHGRTIRPQGHLFECDDVRPGPSYVHVAKRRNPLQNPFPQLQG
jgi:hypothetical protein